ncbi:MULTISPECIES: hypothetical protein [Bradyrhizobium]|uniref:hypothetical protein n=1 Tax=Bradyrhizobium centrosematis TaxID=1300039 RepID=UPI0035B69861
MADMARSAGLVEGVVHPSPFLVMSTTHKTVRGPGSGQVCRVVSRGRQDISAGSGGACANRSAWRSGFAVPRSRLGDVD